MIITSFLECVLPWGQISYWATTVMTNLVSVVPFFGQKLINWFIDPTFLFAGLLMVTTHHNKLKRILFRVICWYPYWILFVKSFFLTEKSHKITLSLIPVIAVVFCTLNTSFPETFTENSHMYFLFYIGINMIFYDHVGSFFTFNIDSINYPILSSTSLLALRTSRFFISRIYGSKIIKGLITCNTILNSTGRATILAGITDGIVLGGFNTYNLSKQRFHEKEQQNRQHRHETSQAERARSENHTEAERARQHERERWAHDRERWTHEERMRSWWRK